MLPPLCFPSWEILMAHENSRLNQLVYSDRIRTLKKLQNPLGISDLLPAFLSYKILQFNPGVRRSIRKIFQQFNNVETFHFILIAITVTYPEFVLQWFNLMTYGKGPQRVWIIPLNERLALVGPLPQSWLGRRGVAYAYSIRTKLRLYQVFNSLIGTYQFHGN